MELSNIVYSSALIFILFLCTVFLIGFLGSQYRKFQISVGERRTDDGKSIYSNNSKTSASGFSQQPALRRTGIIFPDNAEVNKHGDKPKVVKVKSVSRGSLVKEHYNARKLTTYKSKTGILFK